VGPRFGAWSLGFHRIDLSISPANSHIKEKPFLVSIPSADDGDGKTGKRRASMLHLLSDHGI
jgi:hypothetical protein